MASRANYKHKAQHPIVRNWPRQAAVTVGDRSTSSSGKASPVTDLPQRAGCRFALVENDTVRASSQQPKLTVKLQLSVGPAATNHQKSFSSCGGHEP
jgi:hypothetical protein